MRRLALLLMLWPALAFADDEKPAAPDISKDPAVNERFHAGLEAYRAGDYATASREFETAYKMDPVPTLLFTWAQAEREGGNCDKAMPLYKKYLYSDINKKQVEATREKMKLCDGKVSTPPPKQPEPTVVPTETRPRWYENKLGGGLTVAGVVGVGLGIVYFAKASGTRSDADKAMFLDDFKSGLDEATTERRIGAVSLTIGLGLIASGIAVYVIEDKKSRKLVAGTDGRTIFIGARF